MKRLFDLLAIVFLLLLATTVFFLFSFHPDRYKSDFLSWVNQQSDWQLNYASSQWSLTQPLQLQVLDLSVAKPNQAALMAKQAELKLALLPLFKGIIRFDSVVLDNTQMALSEQLLNAGHAGLPLMDSQSSHWFKQLEVGQILAKDGDITWQRQAGNFRLERLELAIEDLSIELQQAAASYWQFTLHGSAQQLVTPWQTITLPQLSLAYAKQQLVIDHIGADLLGGSFYAAAELSQQQLTVKELALNNLKFEHFATPSANLPEEVDAPSTDSLNLSWLKHININKLLLNQVSVAAQYQGYNLVLNKLTAELNQLQSTWPLQPAALHGEFAFIADELYLDQFQFSELTASGQLQDQQLTINALRSQLFKGQLELALSYQWQQRALTLHQLLLTNNEIPIQPTWLPQPAATNHGQTAAGEQQPAPSSQPALALQELYIEQADLQQVKLLSYIDTLPFSANGLNLELRQLSLIKQGQWQTVEQLWQPQSRVFMEAPELAFRGLVLSHSSIDLGSEQQLGYLNLYGELPLGQFELQGQSLLDQPNKPWQAQLSGLLLDISPLARLADNPDFKLVGDVELAGKLRGKLSDFWSNLDGELELHSQLLQLPGADLEITLDQIIETPRQYFEDPSPLIAKGWPVFWRNPKLLPRGLSQFTNVALSAEIKQGVLHLAPQQLHGLRYPITVAGEIDLAEQRFEQLKVVVSDKPCWRLVQTSDGSWSAPQISFDHYLSPRRYLQNQQQFIEAPKHPECRYSFAASN
ncbi:AsmA-like C-terminal region-containing protein [Agarivorans sp.]|uniref:AsmA-like C-terminal region-containing protein n=1 Tax=Agarivorans sp. TaxID=1872412 RepID=UPI003D000BBC